jgi:hypothetical protein
MIIVCGDDGHNRSLARPNIIDKRYNGKINMIFAFSFEKFISLALIAVRDLLKSGKRQCPTPHRTQVIPMKS